jgi:uncharacterized protein YegP (UPF0339 family)
MGDRDTWEIYKDRRDEWRWRRRALNGRIVGASTEGYKNRSACVDNAKRNGYNLNEPEAEDMSKPPMYPIDTNPRFVQPNNKDSFVIRILRSILGIFSKKEL